VLRLDRYTDRFRISPSNGTRSTTAHIIVVNSSLIDVDFGQQYYSFMVCLSRLLITILQFYGLFVTSISSNNTQLYGLCVTSLSLILK